MPDLLLELLSEEIPARMQRQACENLKKLVTDAFVEAGLTYSSAVAQATPRRLFLLVTELPVKAADTVEERRGPKVGAPEGAVQGFLKSVGFDLSQVEKRETPKGAFYFAKVHKTGRLTTEIAAEILPGILKRFPWPKSMRFGAASASLESLRWVRPLQSILCLFSVEGDESEVIEFEIDGIRTGRTTRGHRFMAPAEVTVSSFSDYNKKLGEGYVILDPVVRGMVIENEAKTQTFAQGLDWVRDDALLAEVAGLVEWPVVLMGEVAEEFRDLPPEVLATSMRTHQKFFSVRKPSEGEGRDEIVGFITVANVHARDNGAAIIAGNQRVLAARLADARFFWETDRKTGLAAMAEKLKAVTFHAKLGTQAERVERIAALAREIAGSVCANPDLAEEAARLAKADLMSEMVGEFPELQGLMGRYYAEGEHKHPAVARAIEDHYRPAGAGDRVAVDPVSIAVALADKLDTLVGFWAIDEKPTGSKDPYALRRAALGVIRTVLENGVRLGLNGVIRDAKDRLSVADSGEVGVDLLSFFADRLKVHLREEGIAHDRIDAIFRLDSASAPANDDLWLLVERVKALDAFLKSADGAALVTAYRRAANILKIEEKKDGHAYDGAVDPDRFSQDEERALFDRIAAQVAAMTAAIGREDFADAMGDLAKLRGPVDAFFDRVTVNADDADLRANRLNLLARIRAAMHMVADFSFIEG